MKAALSRLLDALYPRDAICFACDREAHVDANGLCESCAALVHPAGGLPPPPGIAGLYAAFWYEQPLHAAIYRFKYGGAKYLAYHFAAYMHLPAHFHVDAMTPVPLSAQRLRERGYNQSALLCRMLCERPCCGERPAPPLQPAWLTRTRDTAPQAGLPAHLRMQNLRGAFLAAPAVKGKSLLLIDDVVTTGSTLAACTHALLDAGAHSVYAACVCAAPLQHIP